MSDLGPNAMPDRIGIDAHGYGWRAWDALDYLSMVPQNPDNSPIPQPVTWFVPAVASDNGRRWCDRCNLSFPVATRTDEWDLGASADPCLKSPEGLRHQAHAGASLATPPPTPAVICEDNDERSRVSRLGVRGNRYADHIATRLREKHLFSDAEHVEWLADEVDRLSSPIPDENVAPDTVICVTHIWSGWVCARCGAEKDVGEQIIDAWVERTT